MFADLLIQLAVGVILIFITVGIAWRPLQNRRRRAIARDAVVHSENTVRTALAEVAQAHEDLLQASDFFGSAYADKPEAGKRRAVHDWNIKRNRLSTSVKELSLAFEHSINLLSQVEHRREDTVPRLLSLRKDIESALVELRNVEVLTPFSRLPKIDWSKINYGPVLTEQRRITIEGKADGTNN